MLMLFDLQSHRCIEYVKSFRDSQKFVKTFREDFEFILAYHGTRVDELERCQIEELGLKIPSVDLLIRKAENRLIREVDSLERQIEIAQKIHIYYGREIPMPEINFTLDKGPLIGVAYQYLLFGPELIIPNKVHHIPRHSAPVWFWL